MNFPKLNAAWKKSSRWVNVHSPELLLGTGLASGVASLYFTIRATIKSVRYVDSQDEKLPGKVIAKRIWKNYIPAALSAGASAACFVGMHRIQSHRNAALAAAYAASNASLLEYKNKVIEKIGEKEEKEVEAAVLEDKVKAKPITATNVEVIDPHGSIYYEKFTDKYLRIDIERVYKAIVTINREIQFDPISLNYFFELIDWKWQEIGDDRGWPASSTGIEFNTIPVKSDTGEAVLGFKFWPEPVAGYDL